MKILGLCLLLLVASASCTESGVVLSISRIRISIAFRFRYCPYDHGLVVPEMLKLLEELMRVDVSLKEALDLNEKGGHDLSMEDRHHDSSGQDSSEDCHGACPHGDDDSKRINIFSTTTTSVNTCTTGRRSHFDPNENIIRVNALCKSYCCIFLRMSTEGSNR